MSAITCAGRDSQRKRNSVSGGRCLHDVVVGGFVHGWKNNPSPYNETHKNLLAFNKL